mgnify:CR=1 FL=1
MAVDLLVDSRAGQCLFPRHFRWERPMTRRCEGRRLDSVVVTGGRSWIPPSYIRYALGSTYNLPHDFYYGC